MSKLSKIVEEAFFQSRQITIFGEISMELAEVFSAQLLALASMSSDPIRVYINSPGGHVEAGDTMHDMIKYVDIPVFTIGTGWVASAGALIFLGARKDRRISLPNTRYLLHQPSGGAYGKASDIAIQAKEIIKMKERINQIISKETGSSIDKVRLDTEKDYWLTASEAQSYGVVHKIISSFNEI